jgi:allantoinase
MIVLPGLIDPHVNLQDLAKEQWEGFAYGTAAAAAGGVTTLVDLPMMKKPNLTSVKNLIKHIEVAQTEIKVDVAFLSYLSDDNVSKIEEFIKDG